MSILHEKQTKCTFLRQLSCHLFTWLVVLWLVPLHNLLQAQTYSKPIVITKGGTYKGNWESRDSEVAAVEIRTSEPVIIEHSNIRGAGPLIRSLGNKINLTVRHTHGYGITPTPYRDYKKARRFLGIDVFKSVVVENCYMENTAGIYIGHSYVGNGTTSETIRIRYNVAKNIDGRIYGGTTFAQFVQFNFRSPIPHAEVAWNQVINSPNNSAVEDNINIHNSRGTATSPIRIHNNYIQGAYPIPANGTSYSGGGIITDGDGDINTCPAYIDASNNQLVNLGNYSMGIAGGNNIRYHHNRVVNSALFRDGSRFAMYTSGLWSKDYYNKNTTFDNRLDYNLVGVTAWGYANNRNDISVAQNAIYIYNEFIPGGAVPASMEDDEYNRWKNKLQQCGIVLGPKGGVSAVANQAPTISITAPTANATFGQGIAIPIAANAADADGYIAKVEFFRGSTKIGESATTHTFNWTNATAGTHSITAKATDNKGATKTSSAVSITVTSSVSSTGKITREYWANITGNAISNIPLSTKPTSVSELTLFEAPANIGDNYGQRVRGYVTAPASGQYTFWISGDNDFELWLSTSEDPAKKQKIAYAYNGWTNPREWTKYPTQQSAKITLEAGKRYYIEALMKEEAGGDNLAVGWQLPNGTLERPIGGNRLSPYQLATTSASSATSALTEEFPLEGITAYPNPLQDRITLDMGTSGVAVQEIVILSSDGKVIHKEQELQQENAKVSINIAGLHLVHGLYLLKFTDTAGNSNTIKLIKNP